ncbi:hypothetical protein, partial [Xenorhabdus sp. KK7.4]|uniref:hypothetical protein n=1 Tax=Xenorhabdus sp. KK7.4 TaxID=1851572 RepID=UPI00187CB7AD
GFIVSEYNRGRIGRMVMGDFRQLAGVGQIRVTEAGRVLTAVRQGGETGQQVAQPVIGKLLTAQGLPVRIPRAFQPRTAVIRQPAAVGIVGIRLVPQWHRGLGAVCRPDRGGPARQLPGQGISLAQGQSVRPAFNPPLNFPA